MSTTLPEQQRLPSGIAGFDTILGGGVLLGGLYIIQGAPGTGKTILANQICFHHGALGGQAMFVTLLAENHARMIGNLRQMSFFDETRIGKEFTYLSGFNEMQQAGLPELTKLLRREIQRRRVSLLVIDGLVTAAASAPNEQAFKVFVHDLQEIALATDCTMFMTTNAIREASPEQTMVDGLIVSVTAYTNGGPRATFRSPNFAAAASCAGVIPTKSPMLVLSYIRASRRCLPIRVAPGRLLLDEPQPASPGSMRCSMVGFPSPPRQWSWGHPVSARRRSGFTFFRSLRPTSRD